MLVVATSAVAVARRYKYDYDQEQLCERHSMTERDKLTYMEHIVRIVRAINRGYCMCTACIQFKSRVPDVRIRVIMSE